MYTQSGVSQMGLSICDTKTKAVSHIQFFICSKALWFRGGCRNSRQLSELIVDSLVRICRNQ